MSLNSRLSSLSADEPVALALRLTAILLLLRPMGPGWIHAPLVLTGVLALLSTPVLLSPLTWYVAAALVGARVVIDWPLPDNHIYLLAYWCLAIALALGARARARAETLAEASRMLLGLTFAFAVLWKGLLSPDYRDGRFFTVTLLTDVRFADLVQLAGRMTPELLAHNRSALAPLPEGAELADPPALELPTPFLLLVSGATWGTLALESGLALLFLSGRSQRGRLLAAPDAVSVAGAQGSRLEMLRHGSLLAFCLVTYAVAPVAGFGWLLLAMGCSRCRLDEHKLRAAYVGVWLLVLFYEEVPLLKLMARVSAVG